MKDNIYYNINWEIHGNKIINVFTKTEYAKNGYDYYGFNNLGYYFDGTSYDREGKTRDEYVNENISWDKALEYGFNVKIYDESGFDVLGKNRIGKYKEEVLMEKLILANYRDSNVVRVKVNEEKIKVLNLIVAARKLVNQDMSIEEYCKFFNVNILELINCAKRMNVEKSLINELYKFQTKYVECTTEFNRELYLRSGSVYINGNYVIPSEIDVDNCVNYLKKNNYIVYDKKVRELVAEYIKGDFDLSSENKYCKNVVNQSMEDLVNELADDTVLESNQVYIEQLEGIDEFINEISNGTVKESKNNIIKDTVSVNIVDNVNTNAVSELQSGNTFKMCRRDSKNYKMESQFPVLYENKNIFKRLLHFIKKLFMRRNYGSERI